MIFKFLIESNFYHTFFDEICEVQCGKHYDAGNSQHVEWLKQYIKTLYLQGGEALCLYSDDNELIGLYTFCMINALKPFVASERKQRSLCLRSKKNTGAKGMGKCSVGKQKNIYASGEWSVFTRISQMT